MTANNLLVARIIEDLKIYAVVTEYPRNKEDSLLFELPGHIKGTPLVTCLGKGYDLTNVDQAFFIDNLLNCRAVQPKYKYINIGDDRTKLATTVTDNRYGVFNIYGDRHIQCHDPKDMKNSLTSYICSHGITAFVHTHSVDGTYVNSVYYGNRFDGLLKYLQLRTSTGLYNAFMKANNGDPTSFVNGDYQESFHS